MTNKWNTFVLTMQRRKLLLKENLADVRWLFENRRFVPDFKAIKGVCIEEGASLSKAAKGLAWGFKTKKTLPSCFDPDRIPEYRKMIESCDDADDWEEMLEGTSEGTAQAKLEEIANNYYIIPHNFDIADSAEDVYYL